MTDRTYQNAFNLDKISLIDACANQKTITEACNTIIYVEQITLFKLYDYHCTGCSFYLEGKSD